MRERVKTKAQGETLRLLPCPFCNGAAVFTGHVAVQCNWATCKVGPRTLSYRTERLAVKAWNTRYGRTVTQGQGRSRNETFK